VSNSIYFLNNENQWTSTDNSVMIKVEEMFQRILTWRGEKSFDASDGVDYLSVLNKQAFLKPQVEDITDQYAQYFDVEIEDTSVSGSDVIAIKITVILKSGQTIARTLYP
jgi:hypothetical protein